MKIFLFLAPLFAATSVILAPTETQGVTMSVCPSVRHNMLKASLEQLIFIFLGQRAIKSIIIGVIQSEPKILRLVSLLWQWSCLKDLFLSVFCTKEIKNHSLRHAAWTWLLCNINLFSMSQIPESIKSSQLCTNGVTSVFHSAIFHCSFIPYTNCVCL